MVAVPYSKFSIVDLITSYCIDLLSIKEPKAIAII